ncbi:MAG: hypothetical protein ABII72_00140, partial [Parcubacteria group bacterium]
MSTERSAEGIGNEIEDKKNDKFQIHELFSRLADIRNNPPQDFSSDAERLEHYTTQNVDKEKLVFLINLKLSNPERIPTEDIEHLFDDCELDSKTNESTISALLLNHIKLKIIEGDYVAAEELFGQYSNEFSGSKAGTVELYYTCLRDSSCPEGEAKKYRKAALELGVKKIAQSKASKWLDLDQEDSLNRTIRIYGDVIMQTRRHHLQGVESDLLKF